MTDEMRLGKTDASPERLIARLGEATLQGDDFFRELVNSLPAAVYTTDPAGRITYYNEAAAELWGHRPELGQAEWCGSWKLFWPDGRSLPHAECPMAIAVKERRPVRGMEAVAERPDGVRVPFIPYPTPIFNASGTFIGAVNMLVDIGDRKRAEESRRFLASIIESTDDAIISKDINGIITSWNPSAERLFGYLAAEVIGKSITIIIPADRQHEEPVILERIRRGERIDHYETVRQRKDGSLLDISLTISALRDEQGRVIGASKIARDITERKRAEQQTATLAREAEHRTRNILATVSATVQLSQGESPEDLKRAIQGRIRALANAHTLFAHSRWAGAELHDLVTQELAPYCQTQDRRADIQGAKCLLEPNKAQTLAVAVHELATNAAKYGALSAPTGTVRVEWTCSDGQLAFRWIEHGGPSVAPPKRQGFGTRVMETMIRQLQGSIEFDWKANGLTCALTIPDIGQPSDFPVPGRNLG
jgi:PAS domain S-box-containing protein